MKRPEIVAAKSLALLAAMAALGAGGATIGRAYRRLTAPPEQERGLGELRAEADIALATRPDPRLLLLRDPSLPARESAALERSATAVSEGLYDERSSAARAADPLRAAAAFGPASGEARSGASLGLSGSRDEEAELAEEPAADGDEPAERPHRGLRTARSLRIASREATLRALRQAISKDAADERRDIAGGKVPFYLTEKARAAAHELGETEAVGPLVRFPFGFEGVPGETRPEEGAPGSVTRPARAELSLKGILFPDLSYAQRGRVKDWDALAEASRGIVALKVRQVKVDPFFAGEALEEAERRGMIVIGYAFGYGVDGAEQADALLRNFRPRPGRVYALDLEGNPFKAAPLRGEPGKTQGEMTPEQAVGFVERIRARTGAYPVLYTGASYRRDFLPGRPQALKVLARCPTWIAAYSAGSAHGRYAKAESDIWQFTSTGRFPGVSPGGLDVNELMVSYGALREWAGLGDAASRPALAAAPAASSGSLGRDVMARAWLVAEHIRASGGYRADGENGALGFIRRSWDPLLAALGRPALEPGEPPSARWSAITDWAELRPGDILSTHPGYAPGSAWHGGLFAGVKFGTVWVFDNAPGLGPKGRPHDGRFRYFFRPTHELLKERAVAASAAGLDDPA